MILDIPMTLASLQELLMSLRANDADGYKAWLASAIEELLSDIAVEVDSGMVLSSRVERKRKADNHKFIITINSRIEVNLKK